MQEQPPSHNRSFPQNPFDLSEAASMRLEGEDATTVARQAEAMT